MSKVIKQRKKGINKLVGEAITILIPKLQAENAALKQQVEQLPSKIAAAVHVAIEFGYTQCEKGNNLQMAFINYNKLLNG